MRFFYVEYTKARVFRVFMTDYFKCNTDHTPSRSSVSRIFETIQNELIDLKGSENIICTVMKYRETILADGLELTHSTSGVRLPKNP